MVQKVVKEVVQNINTGEVTIEYSDDSTKAYNIDELPVAKVVGGDIVLEVFGETIDVAGSAEAAAESAVEQAQALAESAVEQAQALAESAVEQAQAIATVSGDFVVGETLTVSLPTGWSGSFQWTRDGVAISGETAATYVLDVADEGTVVTCKVSDLVYTAVGNTVVSAP